MVRSTKCLLALVPRAGSVFRVWCRKSRALARRGEGACRASVPEAQRRQGARIQARPGTDLRCAVLVGLLAFVLGAAPAFARRARRAAAPAPAAQKNSPETEARLAALRKKVLRDEDFIESESNRDPFRSYIALFVDRVPQRVQSVPAIFDKFALDELTLIAVISGTSKPLAMFRDPGGLGQVVKRGDYLSKSVARVSKILGDRVVLELTEVMGSGETRAVEKAILVNPEDSQ